MKVNFAWFFIFFPNMIFYPHHLHSHICHRLSSRIGLVKYRLVWAFPLFKLIRGRFGSNFTTFSLITGQLSFKLAKGTLSSLNSGISLLLLIIIIMVMVIIIIVKRWMWCEGCPRTEEETLAPKLFPFQRNIWGRDFSLAVFTHSAKKLNKIRPENTLKIHCFRDISFSRINQKWNYCTGVNIQWSKVKTRHKLLWGKSLAKSLYKLAAMAASLDNVWNKHLGTFVVRSQKS